MVVVLFCCLFNSLINKKIRTRRQAYTKALYKIYRFLDFQLTAGIKTVDAFRGLPDAVHDSIVRPVLVRFSARFELTLDLNQAMEEIGRFFPGTDTNLLATHLRQCLIPTRPADPAAHGGAALPGLFNHAKRNQKSEPTLVCRIAGHLSLDHSLSVSVGDTNPVCVAKCFWLIVAAPLSINNQFSQRDMEVKA